MAAALRQEINIIDGVVTGSTSLVTDVSIVQLDTTQYSATATYYFEVVGNYTLGASPLNQSSTLRRKGTSTDDATCTITTSMTAQTRVRTVFTPPAGQTEYVVTVSGGISSGHANLKAARIIVLQSDATSVNSTETQIEIGNQELAKTNTSASPLSNPKYWKYNAAQWDGTVICYAEITWTLTGTGTGTVKIQQDGGSDNFTFADHTSIVIGGTAATATRVRVPFFPTDGRNYQLSTVNSSSMGSLSIYDAKIVVQQVGQTYYFDASDDAVSDPGAVWSLDASAFDGSLLTNASAGTGGSTASNFLFAGGTNAPTTGVSITSVKARIYGSNEVSAAIYTNGLAELLGTAVSTLPGNGGAGAFVTLSTPTGGWTWQKVNDLEVKCYRSAGTSVAVYRVEVWVNDSEITKSEPQYLLANTGSFGGSTGLKDYDTLYDPADWDAGSGSITYIHEGNGVAAGTGDMKLQSDPNGTPADVTNSTITDTIQREQSASMTMPVASATIDVNVTGTGTLNASRILAQWAWVAAVGDKSVSVSDSTAISDTPTISLTSYINVSDSTAVSDTPTIEKINYLSVSDSTAVTDTPTIAEADTINVSDSTAIGESVTFSVQNYINTTDSSVVADTPTLYVTTWFLSVSDSTAVADTPTLSVQDFVNVSDSTAVSDTATMLVAVNLSVTDSTAVSDTPTIELISYVNVTDSTAVGETITMRLFSNVSVTDSSAIGETVTIEIIDQGVSVTDSTAIGELVTMRLFSNINVLDSTAVSDTPTLEDIEQGINVFDSTAVTDTPTVYITTLFFSVSDSSAVTDTPAISVGADAFLVSDPTTVSDTATLTVSDPQVVVSDSTAIGEDITVSIVSSTTAAGYSFVVFLD